MPRIPDAEIDRLKQTLDLPALIRSRGIDLKPHGNGHLVGLCPFHDDKGNPNLVVTPAKGLFHCLACGAAGNGIQFVQKFDGISFRHAFELLDEGCYQHATWINEAVDERTIRRNLDHARRKRHSLLIAPATDQTVGLPDPKPYYAVLCADGDDMGKVLRGERGPTFAQAYHPWMLEKLQELAAAGRLAAGAPRGGTEPLWDRVRPQGLAAQLAFSSGLNAFTSAAARAIAEHHGTCVYAGGDDVLAVLPVATCLQAAAELAALFRREVGGTLSAGIISAARSHSAMVGRRPPRHSA